MNWLLVQEQGRIFGLHVNRINYLRRLINSKEELTCFVVQE